jgi:hypothetical protein
MRFRNIHVNKFLRRKECTCLHSSAVTLENRAPVIRRSNRKTYSTALLAKVFLICFMAFTSASMISINTVQELSPGIHVKELDDIYLKVSDFTFQVLTSVNITEDFNLMDDQI